MIPPTEQQIQAAFDCLPRLALEVADILERTPGFDLSDAPDEAVDAFRKVAMARSALIELEQKVRDRRAAA